MFIVLHSACILRMHAIDIKQLIVHMHTCTCTHASMHMLIRVYMHAHMHMHVPGQANTAYTCAYTCMHYSCAIHEKHVINYNSFILIINFIIYTKSCVDYIFTCKNNNIKYKSCTHYEQILLQILILQ